MGVKVLFLSLGAKQINRVAAKRQVSRKGHTGGGTDPGELFNSDSIADIVSTGTAILFRENDTSQTELPEFIKHETAVETFFFIALAGRRGNFIFRKLADHVLNQFLFFC